MDEQEVQVVEALLQKYGPAIVLTVMYNYYDGAKPLGGKKPETFEEKALAKCYQQMAMAIYGARKFAIMLQ